MMLITISSCQFDNKEKEQHTTGDSETYEGKIWTYDCMQDSIFYNSHRYTDKINQDFLINLLNTKFENKVHIEFTKLSGDTVYINIPDSNYLTQQMGTCGAQEFMMSTTFTLTELEGIRFVNFDFEFGDHAMPGTYSRAYYRDMIHRNKQLNTH